MGNNPMVGATVSLAVVVSLAKGEINPKGFEKPKNKLSTFFQKMNNISVFAQPKLGR